MSMRLLTSVLIALTLFGTAMASQAAASAPKIKVLLVTGDDVFPAHNWVETTTAVRDLLKAADKFDVKVCEDAAILESKAALQRYDVVFLNMYNAKTPTLSDATKENLLSFVRGGKGFVVEHMASASFKEWPEFKQLDFPLIKSLMNKPLIIDAQNMLDADTLSKLGFTYLGVGRTSNYQLNQKELKL